MPGTSPLPVAVTSWLTPGTAAYNAAFLAAKPSLEAAGCRIAEMGICCYCLDDSLNFSPADWPSPGQLPEPFTFHVHLPGDLPWHDSTRLSGQLAGEKAVQLVRMLSELHVTRAVVHPPDNEDAISRFAGFLKVWTGAGLACEDLMAENLNGANPAFWHWLIHDTSVSVCLDVAHMLAYNQQDWTMQLPPERVRLTHWSAPGQTPGVDLHGPLSSLTPEQLEWARRAAVRFASAMPMLEVFSWEHARESMPVLRGLYAS